MDNEIIRCRTSIDQRSGMKDIRRTDTCPVRLLYSAFHHRRALCRLQSSFNTSNHSGPNSSGLMRMCWKISFMLFISNLYVSSAMCTKPGPTLSVCTFIKYIMLPMFLCGSVIRLILIWLLLCLISFSQGYQHANVFRYCILRSTFASSVCLDSTSG